MKVGTSLSLIHKVLIYFVVNRCAIETYIYKYVYKYVAKYANAELFFYNLFTINTSYSLVRT